MRTKVKDLKTIQEVEAELEVALKDLRDLDGSSNLQAKTSTEYRIGRLRLRKIALEWVA
jgi:hypothetical protein